MGKRFGEMIERKTKQGTLFQHTFAGNDICGRCIYRRPWQDYCVKFKKKIEKVKQSGKYYDFDGKLCDAFHHLPCEECLKYKIQKCDLQFYINSYKKKHPNKVVNIDLDKLRVTNDK